MDSIDLLARRIAEMHRANSNPPSTSFRVGRVVEVGPLKLQWGDSILINEDKLVIPKRFTSGYELPNRWQDRNGNIIEDTVLWKVELSVGDQLIIAPDEDLKMWYIIDLI